MIIQRWLHAIYNETQHDPNIHLIFFQSNQSINTHKKGETRNNCEVIKDCFHAEIHGSSPNIPFMTQRKPKNQVIREVAASKQALSERRELQRKKDTLIMMSMVVHEHADSPIFCQRW